MMKWMEKMNGECKMMRKNVFGCFEIVRVGCSACGGFPKEMRE
jgi:hypothetical protein